MNLDIRDFTIDEQLIEKYRWIINGITKWEQFIFKYNKGNPYEARDYIKEKLIEGIASLNDEKHVIRLIKLLSKNLITVDTSIMDYDEKIADEWYDVVDENTKEYYDTVLDYKHVDIRLDYYKGIDNLNIGLFSMLYNFSNILHDLQAIFNKQSRNNKLIEQFREKYTTFIDLCFKQIVKNNIKYEEILIYIKVIEELEKQNKVVVKSKTLRNVEDYNYNDVEDEYTYTIEYAKSNFKSKQIKICEIPFDYLENQKFIVGNEQEFKIRVLQNLEDYLIAKGKQCNISVDGSLYLITTKEPLKNKISYKGDHIVLLEY